jgi:3D (Asp-Asp-Asp) domain-containing protein
LALAATLPIEEAKVNEVKTFEITAYSANYEDTGKAPGDEDYGITASGSRVKSGDVACPPQYPFGTKFYIPDLNRTYVCTDRGGDIKNHRLDLFMPSRSDVKQFGRQRLEVEIISK